MKITQKQLKQIIKEEVAAVASEGIFDRIKSGLGLGSKPEEKPAAKTKKTVQPKSKSAQELKNDIVMSLSAFDKESPLNPQTKMNVMRSMINDAIAQLPDVKAGAEPKIKTSSMTGAQASLANALEDFIQGSPGLRTAKFDLETLIKKFLTPKKTSSQQRPGPVGFPRTRRPLTGAGRTKSFDI